MKRAMLLSVIFVACSNHDGGSDAGFDAAPACDAGASSGALASFTPPVDPGGGGVLFTASGEELALTGYPFPPTTPGAPAFVDGWDVKFTRLLVTVDRVRLWQNPDLNPGDESRTGAQAAELDGPWAIDLSHDDPSYLPGKGGGGERAVPFAATKGFATDGARYAFGYDLIAATSDSCGRKTMNVNLDAAAQADYASMITNGCVVYYAGTATFQGAASCSSDPVYATWPKAVSFALCFRSPVSYVNCQNPDNDPATPLSNEEHQRGIAFLSDQSVIAQVTVHSDHPFWDSVLHDSPLHFDQFAARADAQGAVTLDLTKGIDFTSYTDTRGNTLKWRYCIDPPTNVHPKLTGVMSFDRQSVPFANGGDPSTGLRDYADFATYTQSTQGHLNSDGLCYVKRNYSSPP